MAESKFNEWRNKIFNQENILSQIERDWFYDIEAKKIKEISGREPRLMTKIDYKENLPDMMKENKLSILAIKNWWYRISKADPFREINVIKPENVKIVAPNNNYKTINPYQITTESQALDVCYVNGILDDVFDEKTNLTIRWRQRNEMDLKFQIDDVDFNINWVQIEVDWWYEGQKTINLVEAKIWSRGNINIRQLLYPELYWKEKVPAKNTKTFLMYYEEPYFYFLPFSSDKSGFCKIDYTKIKIFRFKPTEEVFELYSIQVNEEQINHKAPFPQADDFKKVLAMLTYIGGGVSSKSELQLLFDIDKRQIDYYFNVLNWMNICSYNGDIITLTNVWNTVFDMPSNKKLQTMAKIVFSDKIFNDALKKWMNGINDKDFEKRKVSTVTTRERRKKTVKSWVEFFKENLVG